MELISDRLLDRVGTDLKTGSFGTLLFHTTKFNDLNTIIIIPRYLLIISMIDDIY